MCGSRDSEENGWMLVINSGGLECITPREGIFAGAIDTLHGCVVAEGQRIWAIAEDFSVFFVGGEVDEVAVLVAVDIELPEGGEFGEELEMLG